MKSIITFFPQDFFGSSVTRCYELTPNFEGDVHAKEYTTHVKINAKGLPDDEYVYEKPKDTTRVLAVGDSWVMQYAVNHNESFLTLVEDKFKVERKNVEIIAFGVCGYNTLQEADFLEKEGIKYRPDVVVLFWFPNDLASNLAFTTDPPPACVRDGKLIGK